MPWKLTPSDALRENVMVVLRDSRSTWPDWSTGHRCCTEVGVYLTLPASPSTAAVAARLDGVERRARRHLLGQGRGRQQARDRGAENHSADEHVVSHPLYGRVVMVRRFGRGGKA